MTIRHSGQVYYRRRLRDLLRKTWWVECIYCEQTKGPLPDRGFALLVKANWWGDMGSGPWCRPLIGAGAANEGSRG